jgi:hypothetical protein
MSSGTAWLRRAAGWARDGLLVTACAVAVLAVFAPAPLRAAGETGTPGGSGGAACPSSNPPNQMTLVAGTPQTALVGTAFATGLRVALSNSDGCPVSSAAGIPVAFSAPSSGASGLFSTSNSNTVIVGAEAAGTVAAPPFTANAADGSYTVTASSQLGSVSFALTNTAAGVPARIVAIPLKRLSASVTSRYPQPLQVRVLDATGNPVAGATVTFTLAAGGPSACGTSGSASAGATFASGATQASATTGATGLASSPPFTANATVGPFTATASTSGKEPGGVPAREGSGTSAVGAAATVSFSLSNLAGRPASLTPGVGSSQSTPAGSAFPLRLAVTVTDAHKNPVPDATITFSAPATGASGRFTLRSRGRHRRVRVSHPDTVTVRTGACGIAVAPPFTADDTRGGYIVKARAKHGRTAAFALVNVAPGRSS